MRALFQVLVDGRIEQLLNGGLLQVGAGDERGAGVDPLFRRGGRTVVPIRITGSRTEPSFGLDVKRVFTRRDVAGRN